MKKMPAAEIAKALHKGRERYSKMLDENLDRFAQGTAKAMLDTYDAALERLEMEQTEERMARGGYAGMQPQEFQGGGFVPNNNSASQSKVSPYILDPFMDPFNLRNSGHPIQTIRQPLYLQQRIDALTNPAGWTKLEPDYSTPPPAEADVPDPGWATGTKQVDTAFSTLQSRGPSINGFGSPMPAMKTVPDAPETKKGLNKPKNFLVNGIPQGAKKTGAAIGTVASLATPLVDNITGYFSNKRARAMNLPRPTPRMYAPLDDRVETGAEVRAIRDSEGRVMRSLDRTTQGPAATAAKLATRAESMRQEGAVAQRARAEQRAIRNQNRQGFSDIGNLNADLIDTYRNNVYAKEMGHITLDQQNMVNAVSDILQMQQDKVAAELDISKMAIIMSAYDRGIVERNILDKLPEAIQRRFRSLGIKIKEEE